MDRSVGVVLGIVVTVLSMIAAAAIMWGTFEDGQQQIEDVNPYAGITVQAVCTAAGGTWTAGNAVGAQCHD